MPEQLEHAAARGGVSWPGQALPLPLSGSRQLNLTSSIAEQQHVEQQRVCARILRIRTSCARNHNMSLHSQVLARHNHSFCCCGCM